MATIKPLLKFPELVQKIAALASASDALRVDRAFHTETGDLVCACRDGIGALMQLAADMQIGWQLNGGYRCDVNLAQFAVDVCDNRDRANGLHFFIEAVTVEGALAAGILAVMAGRSYNGDKP